MKNVIIIFIATLILQGCSTASASDCLIPCNRIDNQKEIIEVNPCENYKLKVGNDSSLERAFNQYVKTGQAANIVTDGFIKFAYNQNQQPLIKCAPFQETVITLEKGEKFTNVSSGDPSRWEFAAAVSGCGCNIQQIILVKPSCPNIATNMVITTNRRIYNLRLIAKDNGGITRTVSFWYPEEMVARINNSIIEDEENVVARTPNVNLNQLNFNYVLFSDGFFRCLPSWKPIRIFDDGKHTFIQFPCDTANKELPVLFVLNGGTQELVNYRVKGTYFVTDKIFKNAVLVSGTSCSQSKIYIRNNC